MKKITSLLLAALMLISTFALSTTAYAYDWKENYNKSPETAQGIGLYQNVTVNPKAVYDSDGYYIEHGVYHYYCFYAPETGYYDISLSGMAQYPECFDSVFVIVHSDGSKGYDIDSNDQGQNVISGTVECYAGQPIIIEVNDYTSNEVSYGYEHYLNLVVSYHVHNYEIDATEYDEYTSYFNYCKGCRDSYTSKSAKTPKKVTISKAKAAKKSTTISWKRVTCSGYQVQVATDKKFKKNKKSVTVTNNYVGKCTVKSLKAKKTYYVRVRGYNVVDGKKYYGSWSTVKTVKVK